VISLQFTGTLPAGNAKRGRDPPVVARTVEVDLPAQTTLDQAVVALLKLRRGDLPGDATLDQSAVLRFEYTSCEPATPAVHPRRSRPRSRRWLALEAGQAATNASILIALRPPQPVRQRSARPPLPGSCPGGER